MGKGFAPVKSEKEKSRTKRPFIPHFTLKYKNGLMRRGSRILKASQFQKLAELKKRTARAEVPSA